VTEHELLDLASARKLDAAGVSELTAKIIKNSRECNEQTGPFSPISTKMVQIVATWR
jgi:hypothetical protein